MLSFLQYSLITEEVHTDRVSIRESSGKSEWGFLRPDQKPLRKSGAIHNHPALASRYGSSSKDMVQNGNVRYWHHSKGTHAFGHLEHPEAGYELKDTPAARKLVANHLGASGGFRHIGIDYTDARQKTTSHKFQDVEAALKHLREAVLNESLPTEEDGKRNGVISQR